MPSGAIPGTPRTCSMSPATWSTVSPFSYRVEPRLPNYSTGTYWSAMDATVLIVEDSPSVRRLIEVSVRPLGVRVIAAEDGIRGLAMARSEAPDVILLDIGLPGIDGWEVLRELRADPETADISVIIVTAHAQPEVAAAAER
ncbi:MAG: response regulator, partial [Acidimicrobiia bacterium]